MSFLLLETILVIVLVVTSEQEESTAPWEETTTTTEETTTEYSPTASPKAPKTSTQTSSLLLLAMAGALVVCGCVVSVSLWMLSRRNRVKNFPTDEEDAPSPQKMDSEVIKLSEFQDRGPLVLQARMKGRIKHALDDDKSFSLKEVQFDTKHNEIFTIGSDIEKLDGMSQLSLLSGEKSREVVKGPKRGSFPTMASEAKKTEAAAREAKRVAENERMIALCAERRRAKEAAAASSKSDGKSQPRTSSDDVKSEGIRSDSRKIEVPKSEQRSVLITQRTQASTMSQVREPSRRRAILTSGHRDYDPKPSKTRTATGAAHPFRKSPSAPVVRKKVSRNRSTLDGPGVVKYHATDSSSSSSSRSKKMPLKHSTLQESKGEVQSPPSH